MEHIKDNEYAQAWRYYAFRPQYPVEAFEWIASEYRLDGKGRLLDVGCGTGHVCLGLSKWFKSTIAIDSSPYMLAEARRLAADRGMMNMEFVKMRAEGLSTRMGLFRMVTFGASFHRMMNRDLVAERVFDLLEHDGGLVILCPACPWNGREEWKDRLRNVIKKWCGCNALSDGGEPHPEVLARSGFREIKVIHLPGTNAWTIEGLLGLLYSTSFLSKLVLGERALEFEQDMRRALSEYDASGGFLETTETTIIAASKK
jgi:SAM-dependent methyltransferase